jgi:hypothetical protein
LKARPRPGQQQSQLPSENEAKPDPKTRKGKKVVQEKLAIPFFHTPALDEAWDRWFNYRKEIKRPLTRTSQEQQLEQFEQWGEERAIAAIKHTMFMTWWGLREPRPGDVHFPTNNAKPAKAVNENRQRETDRLVAEAQVRKL